MPESRRDEIPFDTLVKDGNYNANLYRMVVRAVGVNYSIAHGLGYAPVKVQIVEASELIQNPKVVFKDDDQVVLTFGTANTAITLRFE